MSDHDDEVELSDEALIEILEKELDRFSKMEPKLDLNGSTNKHSHADQEALRRQITRPRTDEELEKMSPAEIDQIQNDFWRISLGSLSNEERKRWTDVWFASPIYGYIMKPWREQAINCWKLFACFPELNLRPAGKYSILRKLYDALFISYEDECMFGHQSYLPVSHPDYDPDFDPRFYPDYDPYYIGEDILELIYLFCANDWLDKNYDTFELELKPYAKFSEEELLNTLVPQAVKIARKILVARNLPVNHPDTEYLKNLGFS